MASICTFTLKMASTLLETIAPGLSLSHTHTRIQYTYILYSISLTLVCYHLPPQLNFYAGGFHTLSVANNTSLL